MKRLYTTSASNGVLNVPNAAQLSVSVHSAQLGDPLVPGSVHAYQAWCRDPNPAFCPRRGGATWNLSNAVRIAW